MKKEISQNLRRNRALSVVTILLAGILLYYMISVESEPGAIPVLLIAVGIVWFVVTQLKINKQKI